MTAGASALSTGKAASVVHVGTSGGVGEGVGDAVAVGVGMGGLVEPVASAYMLMAPLLSVPHIIPNGFANPFAYELTALWSRWPVPLTSIRFSATLPIIANP